MTRMAGGMQRPPAICARASGAQDRLDRGAHEVAAAVRELWGNPNPSSTIHEWPMQHPVAAALIWSLVILGACSVVATRPFHRRTSE